MIQCVYLTSSVSFSNTVCNRTKKWGFFQILKKNDNKCTISYPARLVEGGNKKLSLQMEDMALLVTLLWTELHSYPSFSCKT